MANPQQLIGMIQERPVLLLPIVLAVVAVVSLAVWGFGTNKGGGGGNGECAQKIDTGKQQLLAKVDSVGKAIEIQALLAREGIVVDRADLEAGKADINLQDEASICDRDRALIAIVQSGLMDKNIGLESFDKGDLTASREEKRIKLIRAQQGELSRLIRKIAPIEDAAVSLSIPEPTIFKKAQQAMSASVQVTIPSGTRLGRDKVRAIINLVVGSIQGLDAQHVALSDTNGNTYNSVLDTATEMADKLEDQDQYMKQKVANQLDRLVGPGHYVVTVSTLLRETPEEVMIQQFDPDQSAVTSRQRFSENLNAKSGSSGTAGGATSSFVPNELSSALNSQNSSNRGYNRVGEEVSYANTKTQTLQTRLPGMVEDISIAVTVDEDHYPQIVSEHGDKIDMDTNDLKRLIARAASPKVQTDNVSVARISFSGRATPPIKASAPPPREEDSGWLAWAVGAVVLFLLAMAALLFRGSAPDPKTDANQREIQRLQEIAAQQQQQLQATQHQTQLLMEAQQRQIPSREAPQTPQISAGTGADRLKQTLSELKEAVEEEDLDEEEVDLQIKTWIESSKNA